MKSSPSIWHYVVSVKSKVKISSIFVAFLENRNFNGPGKNGTHKGQFLFSKKATKIDEIFTVDLTLTT